MNTSKIYRPIVKSILLCFCLLMAIGLKAQIPLGVEITVIPPYPTQYNVWVSNVDNYMIVIRNNSDKDYEYYIDVEIEGLTHEEPTFIRLQEGIPPINPRRIGAEEVDMLTQADVEAMYGSLDLSNLDISPNIPLEENGELPAGDYQLCTTAIFYDPSDPDNGLEISPRDCSEPFLVSHNNLQMVFPEEGAIVPEVEDTPFPLAWVVNGLNLDTDPYEYVLRLYEIEPDVAAEEPVWELVEEGTLPIFFESAELIENALSYDELQGYPAMTPGNMYAAQVEMTSFTEAYFDNERKSQVVTFWYGYNGIIAQEEEEFAEDDECYQNCYYTELGNTSAVANENLEQIEIGHFTITDIEDLAASGSFLSGTGKVQVPFLNDVFVNVEFDNVQVNSEGRIFEGTVNAVKDEIYDDTEMTPSIAEDFNTMIRNTRLVAGLLGSDASMGLPLGIVQRIAGYNIQVAFTEMTFTHETARCKLVNNLHIPSMGEDAWVSMVGSDICMTPSGFANEFTLHPGTDIHLLSDGDISIDFKGDEDLNNRTCSFQMDCEGVKKIDIAADIYFPESMLLIENPDDGSIVYSTEADAENRVKAELDLSFDRIVGADDNIYAYYGEEGIPEENGIHFIGNATIANPFQIKGVDGWGFEVTEIVVDASEVANSALVDFPDSYTDNGEPVDETWTGFYMENLTMRTPVAFMGGDDRKALGVHDLIIDPTLTMRIAVGEEANPVIGINEGEVDKWSFSLDQIYIDIVQNRFEEGGLNGEIGLPIAEEGTFIEYSAVITDSDTSNDQIDPLEYVFSMQPADVFNVPLLVAQVNLHESSYIKGGIKPGDDAETYFELYAAGGMGLKSDLFSLPAGVGEILPLNSELASFDLKFHSKEGITGHNFGFLGDFQIETYEGNYIPQPDGITGDGTGSYGAEFNEESFNGFPITIIDAALTNTDIANGEFNLMINPDISFTSGETALSADTHLNFPLQISSTPSGNRVKLTGFSVDGVQIDTEIGGCQLSGGLEFYDSQAGDGVGQKGARGNLEVGLPMGIGMKMAAEFGTDVTDPDAAFNTEDNYPYFYVDGMLYFGENGGIPVAGAMALYGVGGGLSYNMTRSQFEGDQDAINAQIDAMRAGPSKDPSTMNDSDIQPTGEIPVAAWDNYGLKLAVTLGTSPLASLINADVSVEAEFGINSGLDLIAVRGDGFMMTPLGERNDPSIQIGLDIIYEKPIEGHHIFTGDLDVWMNLLNVLYGTGNNNKVGRASIFADNGGPNSNGTWYLKLGDTPASERVGLMLGIGNKLGLSANGYFLLGHGLPTTLPVPSGVADLFGNSNSGKGGSLDSGTINGSQQRESDSIDDAQDGSGLAFGAEVGIDVDVDMLGVYAYLSVCLGFDVNITHSESRTCYIEGQGNFAPGVNGWYGLGQIYAGIEGGMGFRVKAFGKNHDLELFKMAAAMMLSGGGPNPIWAEGRAALSISVLGGLIKCNKSIAISAGNQCIPTYNDPFGGVPLIVEHWPEHEEKKQSTWTKPKVAFAFPMNEVVKIPVLDEDGNSKNDYIKPSYKDLSLKERDTGDNVSFQVVWNDGGKEMVIVPNSGLEPKTWYEVSMRLIAYEYVSKYAANNDIGATRVTNPETNGWWYQDTIFTFKTGKLSDLDDNIMTSIPIRNQRFYLQDDINALKIGRIDFIQSAQTDLYFFEEKDGKTYDYKMRFSPMDGSEPLEADILSIPNVSVPDIDYIIPELKNDMVYALQVIRSSNGIFDLPLVYEPIHFVLNNQSAGNNEIESETTVEFTNERINPADDLAANEEALITYFFKTSQFDSFDDKFASYSVDDFDHYTHELIIEVDEGVDKFDVRGERNNLIPDESERKVQDELLQIIDPIHVDNAHPDFVFNYTEFYDSKIEDILIDLATSYDNNKGSITYTIPGTNQSISLPDNWPADDLHLDYLGDPEMRMTRQVVNYESPLTEEDIDASWGSAYNLNSFADVETVGGAFTYAFGGTGPTLELTVPLWDRVIEDAEVIDDWAAEILSNPLHADWIDNNYNKFNNRLNDMAWKGIFRADFNTGKYKFNLLKDKSWDKDSYGEVFKTFIYQCGN